MKRQSKLKYKKPYIIVKKIKINFFSPDCNWALDFCEGNSRLLAQLCGDDPNCSWSCFLQGTKILMSDGYEREIQNLKVGDNVLSYGFFKKELAKSKIIKLLIHQNCEGYLIINNNIKVTAMHRFWVNNKIWKRAYQLKIGDRLLNSKEEAIPIDKIDKVSGTYTVYNLRLDGKCHNYFAEDILVHNWK